MKKLINKINLSVFAISLGLLMGCSGSEDSTSYSNENTIAPSVEAVQARFGSLPLVERFSGNVRSENQVAIFPEITAKIEQVYAENGDYVNQGEVIARLNDDQIKQQVQQAEAGLRINAARLKQAKARLGELDAQLKRTRQLAEKDLSSDLELEQLEAQMASAEADVELAEAQMTQSLALVEERKTQLERTLIKAPVSGNLGQRNAEVGMMASPSTQLFLIGDLSRLRVEIVLTEVMLNRISAGQRARILTTDKEGNDQYIDAEVSRISPFLNEITRSTEATIEVNNENGLLRPGMFVPVDVYFGESEQATLIPVSALYTDPNSGREGIFVATSLGSEIQTVSNDGGSGSSKVLTEPTPVKFIPIDVLARGRMELGVSGVESGKWIVTIGQDLLSEGREQARIRTMSWDRILMLQSLQREDLLTEIMEQRDDSKSGVSL